MKRIFGVTLGILTAIGGFVDIGDLVAGSLIGARFGMHLSWVVVLGVIGICLYGEMSVRVAAITKRGTFDLIRERLGPKLGLLTMVGSFGVTMLTLTAEVGGIALALQLATSVNYLLFAPFAAALVWIVIWRVKFSRMELGFGLLGLALLVFAVALWQLGPDWGELLRQASQPKPPQQEPWPTYLYYGIALLGATMAPYEVFFLSSGGVEEGWSKQDLLQPRLNVFVGFPLGGVLALAIAACAATVFMPQGILVDNLGQVVTPTAVALGKVGLAIAIIGVFAATFGAALETALSAGYAISQYLGWQWGKFVRPARASRFHAVCLLVLVLGAMVILTSIDPIMITEYSLVFAAIALPLTYLPILIVSNDRQYMGDHVNGRLVNALGVVMLVILVVASAAAIPLMLATKAGQ